MLLALDIETSPLNTNSDANKDDALIPHKAKIDLIGLWSPDFSATCKDLKEFKTFLKDNPKVRFVLHNAKFDYKHLLHHGIDIAPFIEGDTQLMAVALSTKVSDLYLEEYEAARMEKNKEIRGTGGYRKGSKHSLKVLAPYFLGVPAFWEVPGNYDNEEYVLKDCEYTWKLHELFSKLLVEDESEQFYREFLLPISKMLVESEVKGISIDVKVLNTLTHNYSNRLVELKSKLDEHWKLPKEAYIEKLDLELKNSYEEKIYAALAKKPNADKDKVVARYQKLYNTAKTKLPTEMNYQSPTQLKWLFKDYYNLDVETFFGDESTGREVLHRLAETREDVKTFLEYRKVSKVLTAFIPTYRSLITNQNKLHCNFNLNGTRTGRLSSDNPNLQQVPPDLHSIFIASNGKVLITKDQSAIEPRLIAFYTGDKNLVDLIENNGDFHSKNAQIMFGLKEEELPLIKDKYPLERKLAKVCGLAMLYGAGPRRLQQSAQQVGIKWDLAKCKEIYERFKKHYKEVYEYKEGLDAAAGKGEAITNLFGRKHVYENPDDIYMKAFNTLIQSSASDLVLMGALKVTELAKAAGLDVAPLLFVHDEVVFEVNKEDADKAEELITKGMTGWDFGSIVLKIEGNTSTYWHK